MGSPLAVSCLRSYLAALTFWVQEPAGPALRTHDKYLAISIELCTDLVLPPTTFTKWSPLSQQNCICDLLHLQKVPLELEVPFCL